MPSNIDPADYVDNFKIGHVDNAAACYAKNGDKLEITFHAGTHKVTLTYTGNATNKAFWESMSTATNPLYVPDRGIIMGTLQDGLTTRNFSIALGRDTKDVMLNRKIHVYVSERPDGAGGPQPDDGSWTGTGKP